MKPPVIALSGAGRGVQWWGEVVRVIHLMYKVNPFRIVTVNPPVQLIYPNKNGKKTLSKIVNVDFNVTDTS